MRLGNGHLACSGSARRRAEPDRGSALRRRRPAAIRCAAAGMAHGRRAILLRHLRCRDHSRDVPVLPSRQWRGRGRLSAPARHAGCHEQRRSLMAGYRRAYCGRAGARWGARRADRGALPADVFAVIGTGRLMAAHDGGSDWQAQTVPSPVAQLTSADGSVWAMSCPSDRGPPTSFGCRPQLWRTRSAAAAWTRVPFPPVRAQGPFDLRLAVATGTIAVVLPAAGNAAAVELLTSRAAGLRWTGRRAPTGDHNKCNIPAALTSNRAGVATTTRTRGSPAETPAPTSPHTASDRRGVRSSISCGRDPQCGFVSAEPTRPTAETRVLVIAEGSEDPLTALRAAGSRLPYWTRLAFPQASAAGDAQRLLPSGLSRAAIRSWRVGQGPPSSLTPRGRPQVIMSRRGSAAPPTRGQARIGAEAA